MHSQTVHVVARGTAKRGKEAALKDALLALVEPTLKEAGCIRYQIVVDPQDPREVAAIEEWASDQALDAHLTTPQVRALFARADELFDGAPELRRYREAR